MWRPRNCNPGLESWALRASGLGLPGRLSPRKLNEMMFNSNGQRSGDGQSPEGFSQRARVGMALGAGGGEAMSGGWERGGEDEGSPGDPWIHCGS